MGGPGSIPGQCKQKNFVQTPIFCFARTQNIKIRWTVNTMWFYIIFLSICYFILQACSFIGVIRVTSPIDINVPTKSLLALKKNWCVFVSLAGSFFTIKLNAYEYEVLVLRTSLFNHRFYFGPCSHVTETQGFVQQKKLKDKRKRPKKWNYTLIQLCHPVRCIHRLHCLHFEKSFSLLIAELLNE